MKSVAAVAIGSNIDVGQIAANSAARDSRKAAGFGRRLHYREASCDANGDMGFAHHGEWRSVANRGCWFER